jgi:hypothetical protein
VRFTEIARCRNVPCAAERPSITQLATSRSRAGFMQEVSGALGRTVRRAAAPETRMVCVGLEARDEAKRVREATSRAALIADPSG